MKYGALSLACFAFFSISYTAFGEGPKGHGDWKAHQLECLEAKDKGGLSATDAASAQAAMEKCHETAKAAGKDGWKAAMESCIQGQPANYQAAFKACHHHGRHGGKPEGESK
jgi:hypothetical protein